MSSEDIEEEDDLLQDELGKDLEEKKNSLSEKEQEIAVTRSSFVDDSSRFVSEIKETEDLTVEQVDDANKILSFTKTQAENLLTSSKSFAENIVGKFGNSSHKVKRNIWILFGAFLALFFVPYFLFPILPDITGVSLPIEPVLLSGIATIAGFIILLFKTSRSIDSDLFDVGKEERESFADLQKNISSVTHNKITLDAKEEKVNSRIDDLKDGLSKVMTVTQEYIPGLKEYYSGIALKTKQEHFALTLRNGLREYGLLDQSIEKRLARFSNMTNAEEKWLDDVTEKISTKMGISKNILKLSYYDYLDDKSKTKNIWIMVQEKDQVKELINVLKNRLSLAERNKLGDTPFTELINQLPIFSIKEFTRLYQEFYNNLDKEKKLALQTLDNLGFSISVEKRQLIIDFFPTTINIDEWSYHLIKHTATTLQKNPSVIWLLYLDRIGESGIRDAYWQKCKDNSILLDEMSEFLASPFLSSEKFRKEDMKRIYTEILSGENSFDVSKLRKNFVSKIQTIERIKSLFAYSLEAKKIFIPEKIREDNFENMVAFSEDYETEISKGIGNLLDINPDFILLFYFDYIQNIKQRRTKFDYIIKQEDARRDLASLLLEKSLVPKKSTEDEAELLSDVLQSLDDFDIDNIRKSYSFYRRIFDDVVNFSELLEDKGIKTNKTPDFRKVIEVLEKENESSRFGSLKKISSYMINKTQWRELNDKEFEAVALTTLVIFLVRYFDAAREEACKAASTEDLAVKSLYDWIDRKGEEERFAKQSSTLQDVFKSVFDKERVEFDQYNDFKRSLEDGKLFGNTNELLGARFKELKDTVEELKSEKYVSMFEKFREPLKNIMDIQVTNNFIVQALKSQIISAYMVTASEGSVVGVVKYLKDACDKLANADERYKNLIIMKPDDPVTGKVTRVGIVPLHMKDFEEFSVLFDHVFNKAADKYRIDNGKDPDDTISAHLIRVFPSDLTFKHVKSGSQSSKTNPLEAITDLVRTELGVVDRLKIVASARENEPPTVALREIITSLFNDNVKIGSLVGDVVKEIVAEHPKLGRLIYEQKFDVELQNRYSVSNNTELATSLLLSNKQNPEGTLVRFTGEMKSILQLHKIELGEAQLTTFSKALLVSLIDVAEMLRERF